MLGDGSCVRLWLIRHGETVWNRRKLWQGHTDVPLSEEGRRQARALAVLLQDLPLRAILSSDLQRARETAEILARSHRLSVETTPRLREVHLGEAEGLTTEEVVARFGQAAVELWRDPRLLDNGFPGGELKRAAYQRACAALEDFALRFPGRELAVVSHSLVMRVVLYRWFPELGGRLVIPNCGFYTVWFDPAERAWLPGEELRELCPVAAPASPMPGPNFP